MENFLQGENKITTVEDFLTKMKSRFGDPYAKKTARNEYRKLYQGRSPLIPFLSDFHKWASMANVSETEQFMNLRDKINDSFYDAIKERDFNDINSMVESLIRIDMRTTKRNDIKKRRKAKRNSPNRKTDTSDANSKSNKDEQKRINSPFICYRCRQPGHIVKNCSNNQQ